MADVTFTIDGKKVTAPAGTLLIEACRSASIAIPSFCYYPGLSLCGACRMCLVRLEKVPKLQTACTTPVAEGMVVHTDNKEITDARKATIELLLVRAAGHDLQVWAAGVALHRGQAAP
jgi:NADH-quinone oxidoreductase subunit G